MLTNLNCFLNGNKYFKRIAHSFSMFFTCNKTMFASKILFQKKSVFLSIAICKVISTVNFTL